MRLFLATCILAASCSSSFSQGVGRLPNTDMRGGAGNMPRPTISQDAQVPLSFAKDYRIGPNDLLEVDVPNLDKDNSKRTVRVNAAGAISMPLIGSIAVGGLSAQQAEEALAQKYGEKYLQSPQVSVFIKEFTTERVTVEGAVNKPGIYPLASQMTLLRALALAGGFGPIANPNEVMLFRLNEQKTREVAVYDIDMIRSGKSEDPPIRGDDLIVVQRDSARRMFKDSLLRDIIDAINPFSPFVH